jgi:hypothetical protein
MMMHMPTRIHIVLDGRERDAFRARAAADGVSLSEWLRQAARERLARERPVEISTVADLDRFFAQRATADQGVEPDWGEHLAVMERSRRGRRAAT